MPVIAITRELGSLGADIAQGVGRACGAQPVYEELIDRLAARMSVCRSRIERLLDGSAGLLERMSADRAGLSVLAADEIGALAARDDGIVISGWGATHLLREVPHAVCVRICAPLPLRRRRLLEDIGGGEGEVSRKIRRSDAAQGALARCDCATSWTDPEHYDVVLNTERVGVAQCTDKVMALAQSGTFAPTDDSTRQLQDLALVWRVRAALLMSPETCSVRFALGADGGRVMLAGIVEDEDQLAQACEVAAAVPGVRELESRLRAADAARPRFS